MPLYPVTPPPKSSPVNPDSQKIATATSSYWTFKRKGDMVIANFESGANNIYLDTTWRTYGTPPVGFRPIMQLNPVFCSPNMCGLVNFLNNEIQFFRSVGSTGNTNYVRCFLSYFTNDPFPS